MLEEIEAQHALQADGRASAFSLGIVRLDEGQQLGPRDDFFHPGQEGLAAGGLLLGRELGLRKRGLLVHASLITKTQLRSKNHAD